VLVPQLWTVMLKYTAQSVTQSKKGPSIV
jgi:hypothetical protein